MNIAIFEKFVQKCSLKLPNEIDKILKKAKGKKVCAIGFITTDDFYGFYLSWDYSNNLGEFFDWENSLNPKFLYQPLVDIVESCEDIDFCNPSDEKWEFAQTLIAVLEKIIKQIPDEIFHQNDFKREDILFFATMSDGDYMDEMLDESVKMFNASKTVETYGII